MQDEKIDPATGEITTDLPRNSAADGTIIPATALSAGTLVDLLEDGQFSIDAYQQIRELGEAMTDIGNATGMKTKGRVTITIDLAKDGEAFTVQGSVKVKAPEMPRPKSIMWSDDGGNFCRFPPNQTQMFGTRPIRRI